VGGEYSVKYPARDPVYRRIRSHSWSKRDWQTIDTCRDAWQNKPIYLSDCFV